MSIIWPKSFVSLFLYNRYPYAFSVVTFVFQPLKIKKNTQQQNLPEIQNDSLWHGPFFRLKKQQQEIHIYGATIKQLHKYR